MCLVLCWSFAGSWLVLGGSWRLVKMMQKIDAETLPKSSKNNSGGIEKIMKNGAQIHAKCIQNDRGDALAAFEAAVGSGNGPGGGGNLYFFTFLHHLGGFWMPFWAQLAPKGVHKSFFLAYNLEKMKKRVPKTMPEKTLKLG